MKNNVLRVKTYRNFNVNNKASKSLKKLHIQTDKLFVLLFHNLKMSAIYLQFNDFLDELYYAENGSE